MYDSRYGRNVATLAVTRSTKVSSAGSSMHGAPLSEREERRQDFERLLEHKSREGGFFALTVTPAKASEAADWLAATYDLEIVSVDAVFIDVLRERANAAGVDWTLLLDTDAPDAPAAATRNMSHFMRGEQVVDEVYDRITQAGDRVLLVDPGLLGHWNELAGTMDIIERLRDRTRDHGPSVAWILVPVDAARGGQRPKLDGVAVPVDPGDFTRIPAELIGEGVVREPKQEVGQQTLEVST